MLRQMNWLRREFRHLGAVFVRSFPEFALLAVIPTCVLASALVLLGVW